MEQYLDSMLATRRRGHKSTATIASSRISQLFSNDVNTFQQETDTTMHNQSTKHLRRKAARPYRQKRGFSCKLPGVPSSWNNTWIACLRQGAETTSQLQRTLRDSRSPGGRNVQSFRCKSCSNDFVLRHIMNTSKNKHNTLKCSSCCEHCWRSVALSNNPRGYCRRPESTTEEPTSRRQIRRTDRAECEKRRSATKTQSEDHRLTEEETNPTSKPFTGGWSVLDG